MINNYGIDNGLFEIDIVIAAGFVLMCSIRLINPSRVERVRVDVFMLFKVYECINVVFGIRKELNVWIN